LPFSLRHAAYGSAGQGNKRDAYTAREFTTEFQPSSQAWNPLLWAAAAAFTIAGKCFA